MKPFTPSGAAVLAALCAASMHATSACGAQGDAAANPGQARSASDVPGGFRGVFFNPYLGPDAPGPWMIRYDACRGRIREILRELVDEAKLNLVTIFVPMPHTLANPPQAPQEDQALADWCNTAYLDNVAAFVDDCADAGLQVELDPACNLWAPHFVDSDNHVANRGHWPVPGDAPWNEAALWYQGVIEYVEARAKHPENIAMWAMMGNYALGTAEPTLWDCPEMPEIIDYTERFVKAVWPVFRAAGHRPKAAPYAFPIFSNNEYWMVKTPEERLSGFANLKKWLIDDLAMPPDYWPMSTYPYCEPAPDGVHYLRRIVEILGAESAGRILSTDLKGPGHDTERAESIIPAEGRSGADMLEWHFQKCREFGFAGWWIWAYQDLVDDEHTVTADRKTGIRTRSGAWKTDLIQVVRRAAAPSSP